MTTNARTSRCDRQGAARQHRSSESLARCIALIGMRGCGKSVVALELAAMLGGQCVDTDELVVGAAGKSIAAIFEDEGEVGFRVREREAIKRAVAAVPAVISVGGGAVLDEENVRTLRKFATLVWLTAPPGTLQRRIMADPATASSRPALTDEEASEEITHLLAERGPIYERVADLAIDTVSRTPREVARAIVAGSADHPDRPESSLKR